MQTDISALFPEIPQLVFRHRIGELTFFAVSPRTASNHDSAGTGPKERYIINGKVAYSRNSFIEWLSARTHLASKARKAKSKTDALFAAVQPASTNRDGGEI